MVDPIKQPGDTTQLMKLVPSDPKVTVDEIHAARRGKQWIQLLLVFMMSMEAIRWVTTYALGYENTLLILLTLFLIPVGIILTVQGQTLGLAFLVGLASRDLITGISLYLTHARLPYNDYLLLILLFAASVVMLLLCFALLFLPDPRTYFNICEEKREAKKKI